MLKGRPYFYSVYGAALKYRTAAGIIETPRDKTLRKWPHCTEEPTNQPTNQPNKQTKNFALFQDPLFCFAPNSNILEHLQISWFRHIFKFSPRLAIVTRNQVTQAEIFTFPSDIFVEANRKCFDFVSHPLKTDGRILPTSSHN